MNKQLQKIIIIGFLAVLAFSFYACQGAGGNKTGSEYMPDMAHSIAYEANVYSSYYLNTWDDGSVLSRSQLSHPKEPVQGTVPRGYAGVYFAQNAQSRAEVMELMQGSNSADGIAIPMNGSVPYYYGDTEEERARATAEILYNPFPITANGLARGKALYNIYCAICHGTKGNFNDGIYEKGVYPLAPANLISDDFIAASNGRLYHAIMYGKNAMGPYPDKLSYEERWQVIHYIRSLQAAEKKLAYSEEENTLNAYAIPGIQVRSITPIQAVPTPGMEGGDSTTVNNPPPGELQSDTEDAQHESGSNTQSNGHH